MEYCYSADGLNDYITMVKVEKRGISAITAATMIATRHDENPATNNVEFIKKNFSKLNASLWNMIKNDQSHPFSVGPIGFYPKTKSVQDLMNLMEL